MSLNASSMISINRSKYVESSTMEESAFNKNVSFSQLDLSEISNNESTKNQSQQDASALTLSVALEQKEIDMLKENCTNVNTSVCSMDVSKLTNETLQHTSKNPTSNCTTTLRDLNSTTIEEISMVTDVDDEEMADESVIPVDDEDEELTELSNLEQNIQEEMFTHLQPSKSQTDQEPIHDDAEQENLPYVVDESKIFQYPFVELGRRLWPSTVEKQHYTKGCLWSPDGTCLLVPVHLDGMHIVELPTDMYTMEELNVGRDLSELPSAVHVKEGGTVYDCCWYPFMNSADPISCSWLATRQHEPIHMWDAFTGELRCSYRGYDDVDEVESAISIIFSNDAQKVIGGYKKNIKIFDTNIPGRDCTNIPVKKAVSCFALTAENNNCVTAGTWSGYIHHYDLRSPKLGPLFALGGHNGGITWLKYASTQNQNWYLFSGARKDNKILQWDMRNYKEPLQVFERNVQTNQRIYYDLTPQNKWLASGDTEGLLRIWNLDDKEDYFELPLHQDCCNGVSFHPTLPIISTTSGQYHFIDMSETEECSEKHIDYENSMLILWYGPSKECGAEM